MDEGGEVFMKEKFSILIAEDDPGHFALIRRHLNKLGFRSRIIHFKDGREILDFLLKNEPGVTRDPRKNYLIILDIRMPKVDGVTVLKTIKNTENLCDIPVIMLTCSDDEEEIKKCRVLGCRDYVVKPTETIDFASVIRRVADSLLLSIIEVAELDKKIQQLRDRNAG